MYGFVKEKSENTHISSCEVLEIENKYNINFPTILKEYYLQHKRSGNELFRMVCNQFL